MHKLPSRAQRRSRSRRSEIPNRRDGNTRVLYGAFAILLVAIVAVFGGLRWNQQLRIALAYATPSPGPNSQAHAIVLSDGVALGARGLPKRTPTSASGLPVDGISCDSGMTTVGPFLHVHSHLSLFVRGRQMQIPGQIGFTPTAAGECLYWLHTHDASGIIHVEAPHLDAPGRGGYTLGAFFHIWGERLSRRRVGPYAGRVIALVNGAQYTGNLNKIALVAHQQITLEVGTPLVPAPFYLFPVDD